MADPNTPPAGPGYHESTIVYAYREPRAMRSAEERVGEGAPGSTALDAVVRYVAEHPGARRTRIGATDPDLGNYRSSFPLLEFVETGSPRDAAELLATLRRDTANVRYAHHPAVHGLMDPPSGESPGEETGGPARSGEPGPVLSDRRWWLDTCGFPAAWTREM
ncbi:MAG TPA: hypothetical protein VFQ39_18615, partial [Longimicrobium sp.]|nr:hypothetical protein [Longimicrobium sp.]